MRAVVRRILRLEVLAVPQLNEHGEQLEDLVRAARKRHFEATGENLEDCPRESLADARSISEIILRSRQLYQESTCTGSALGA